MESGFKSLPTPEFHTFQSVEIWVREHPIAVQPENQLIKDPGTNDFVIMQCPYPCETVPHDGEAILSGARGWLLQANSWVDAFTFDFGLIHLEDKNAETAPDEAVKLYLKIYDDMRDESLREETIWTAPASELLPGEHVWLRDGMFVLTDRGRKFEAPPEVKAQILMEGLRHSITNYTAIHDFEGTRPTYSLVNGWRSAWFDARNVYCRHSQSAKFFDLSNQEQVCK